MTIIFYSWQNDSPRKTNHDFIKECLKDAAKRISEESQKDVEVQDGVRGESGTPPLADTILKRIAAAQVYVADLSLAYEATGSKGIRRSPNPNVTFEFGYAVAELSHARVIGVLNEYYGHPDNFPFDLQHLRWPIIYNLAPDCSNSEREKCKKRLTAELEKAVKTVLSEKGPQRLLTPRRAAITTALSALVELNQKWQSAMAGGIPGNLREPGLAQSKRVAKVIDSLKTMMSAATTIWEMDRIDAMIADLRLTIAGSPEVLERIALEQRQIEKLQNMMQRLQNTKRAVERLEQEKMQCDAELAELDAQMLALKSQLP